LLNALKRTRASETGLVAVVLTLSIHFHKRQGRPPPFTLSSRPNPDFLPRIAGHSRVCCFRYGKQHGVRQRHQARQEIRGSAAEGRDLQFALMEKRNPESSNPRHFRCVRKRNCRSLPSATPDFLSNLVALANFMRLSLPKAADVAAGQCRVAGKPGGASVGMTKWKAVAYLGVCGSGWTESAQPRSSSNQKSGFGQASQALQRPH
jgi:hypothetical protein